MATRDEVVAAVVERYARSSRLERGRILDEFVALTGHHRKHAMRLLRAGGGGRAERRVRRERVYDAAMREAVIVLWEASVRWSLIFGQAVKLGLRERRTAPDGGQADEVFVGVQGEGGTGSAAR